MISMKTIAGGKANRSTAKPAMNMCLSMIRKARGRAGNENASCFREGESDSGKKGHTPGPSKVSCTRGRRKIGCWEGRQGPEGIVGYGVFPQDSPEDPVQNDSQTGNSQHLGGKRRRDGVEGRR